jgi:hypothetical protein
MNKRKVIYTEAPKGISAGIVKGEVVPDFLPPPEELIRKEPKVKISIILNPNSAKIRVSNRVIR